MQKRIKQQQQSTRSKGSKTIKSNFKSGFSGRLGKATHVPFWSSKLQSKQFVEPVDALLPQELQPTPAINEHIIQELLLVSILLFSQERQSLAVLPLQVLHSCKHGRES